MIRWGSSVDPCELSRVRLDMRNCTQKVKLEPKGTCISVPILLGDPAPIGATAKSQQAFQPNKGACECDSLRTLTVAAPFPMKNINRHDCGDFFMHD